MWIHHPDKKNCSQCGRLEKGVFLKSEDKLRQSFYCDDCMAKYNLTPESFAPKQVLGKLKGTPFSGTKRARRR